MFTAALFTIAKIWKQPKLLKIGEWIKKDVVYMFSRILLTHKKRMKGFPGGTVVKNLPINAGDMGLIPGLGRSHMLRRN